MSVIELTRELLRYETVNPPAEERACATHLGRLLETAGFATHYYEFAAGRATLVARIGGNAERAPLGMTGHIDTVPLGRAPWAHDPYAGETDGDRLYGRGASDMKSGVAAMVVAAIRLSKSLARSPGVVFVITAGEETGHEGAKHVAAQAGALGRVGALLVGEPTENYPLIGSKGSLKLELRAKGVTAHAAMPEAGVNAVLKAARAVCQVDAYRFGIESHPVMGDPTLNIGYFHGGMNLNSVPDAAAVGIDIRTVHGQSHDAIEADLQRAVGDEVEVARLRENAPAWVEPDHPWVRQVFEIVTPFIGERPHPRTAHYGTDGPSLSSAMGAPPSIILGPGELATMHMTDEWCSTQRIETAVEIYEKIICAWCGIGS